MDDRLTITASTKVLGIIGYPVAHSLSPAMHNAAFRSQGLDWVYLPLPVPPGKLADALRGLGALGMVGANVTVPYKESVAAATATAAGAAAAAAAFGADCVEALTPEAELIGAVNVLGFKDGSLIGHNTDGTGFLQALQQDARFTVKGKRVLILGAGGAARAVALTLARHGAQRIGIANRTWQRAEELAQTVEQRTGTEACGLPLDAADLAPWLRTADLVVQASSVGLHPDEETETLSWFDPSSLSSDALVCDLIYNPSPTRFLALAAARGCRTMDGLGMLLYQGTQAYTWWTGREAPVAVMQQALLDGMAALRKS